MVFQICPKGPTFSKISQMKVSFFISWECITISILSELKKELYLKEKDFFGCFVKKRKMNLNAVSKIGGFLIKIFIVSTNMIEIKIQLS